MNDFYLHLMNARHDLTPVMSEVRSAARHAVTLAARHADLPGFDLVVRAGGGHGSPDGGLVAEASGVAEISLTLAPGRFSEAALVRALVRRIYQLIRWQALGMPRSLGDMLVAEGLAGHFARQVIDGKPDPWDETRPVTGLARTAMNEWARRDHDPARWFQGRGDLRRWSGYGLGWRLVSAHLDLNPADDAVSLARVGTDAFRPALRRVIATETGDPEDEDETAPTQQEDVPQTVGEDDAPVETLPEKPKVG